ncbi:cytochrome P450 [Undibacterium arcticum]
MRSTKIRIGSRQLLVLSDHAVIGNLLRDRPDAVRRTSYVTQVLTETGISGLFTAEMSEWRKQRKLVMRALTADVIRNFFPTLISMIERLLRRWQAAVADADPIDMLRDLKAFTLDVTVAMAMGQDINTLEHDDNPLQQDIEAVFNRIGRRVTMPFPYWRYVKLPIDRAADACMARIIEAVSSFITQTRNRLDQNPSLRAKPTNMLEALVAARDEPDSEFTDADVIGNAVTMVFAGEDTTANTLAWLMNLLASDPQATAHIAAEADAACGEVGVLQEFHALEHLVYSEAAIHEAMRLKPVAPALALEVNSDLVIEEDLLIPKGTEIMAMLRRAAQEDAQFTQPDDFRPERWLSDPHATTSGDITRQLFAFGGGTRLCPGRYLAMTEMKMVMSMVVRNFALELDADAPPVEEIFLPSP